MFEELESMKVAQTKEATIVEMELEAFGRKFTASGTSKRDPGDKYDFEVGMALAISRAMTKLAAKVEKAAHRRVVSHPDVEKKSEPILKYLWEGVRDVGHRNYEHSCIYCRAEANTPCVITANTSRKGENMPLCHASRYVRP